MRSGQDRRGAVSFEHEREYCTVERMALPFGVPSFPAVTVIEYGTGGVGAPLCIWWDL